MLKVTVTAPKIEVDLDLRLIAEHAAASMRDFWADQLDAGKQPDGSPLPLNKEGKPLGRGEGTLIRNWQVRTLARQRLVGRAYVQPFQRGRYKVAVFKLAKRGLRFQSFDGESATAWNRVATRVATEALAEALRKQKRRRRKVVSWEAKQGEN